MDRRFESGTAHVRPCRLARPRTPAFHADNTGSNPVGDAEICHTNLEDELVVVDSATTLPAVESTFRIASAGLRPENNARPKYVVNFQQRIAPNSAPFDILLVS